MKGVELYIDFKRIIMSLAICLVFSSSYAVQYRTAVFSEKIKTLQVLLNGEPLSLPVVELGSDGVVVISFDELSYENSAFYYRIIHCSADWSPSGLSSMEYLEGFDGNVIDTYDYSVNTTINYIHYSLTLPNDDVLPKLSGNYAVLIARDNDFDNQVVACACFSVVEPLASFNAAVSGNTMFEINGAYQQLDVELGVGELNASNPVSDFVFVVRQNGRIDNERILTSPTYIGNNTLQYKNKNSLVFEAGNQYRSIDFSSRFTYGAGIDHIEFAEGAYQVVLEPAYERVGDKDVYLHDAFGSYVINLQSNFYPDTEADYMWVHFYYSHNEPYIEGRMFLLGDLTSNALSPESEMLYDMNTKMYYRALLLKQGGYNFVFAIQPKVSKEKTLAFTEGCFWQSRNRYDMYLYYRPLGARYDRLVGFHSLISNQ